MDLLSSLLSLFSFIFSFQTTVCKAYPSSMDLSVFLIVSFLPSLKSSQRLPIYLSRIQLWDLNLQAVDHWSRTTS